ncbi:MAG: methylated-DNA--[protein]-cysteine S-methyltransferase [Actinobacteria bacterium]|nr:methylated-DNA--[protein]-cysteine S-methyltransferase [Actinomycetota bacterium]
MRDVTYCLAGTALGDLFVASTEQGVCTVDFEPNSLNWIDHLAGSTIRKNQQAVKPIVDEIQSYLAGELQTFTCDVDLTFATAYAQRVLHELRKVPFGEVTSYGQLARRIGSSPRAVGGAVGRNPIPIIVPCHRVLAGDGSLGGFSGGLDRKRALLAIEGRVDLPGGWFSARAPEVAQV